MNTERTVVMTGRKQQGGETEHHAGRWPDTHPRASLLPNRAEEVEERGLASPPTCSGLERSETSPRRLEDTARAALDLRAGRALTDVEWARVRVRLLEFATILRAWDEQAKTAESGLGNVV